MHLVVTHEGEDKYGNYPSVYGPFDSEAAAEGWVLRSILMPHVLRSGMVPDPDGWEFGDWEEAYDSSGAPWVLTHYSITVLEAPRVPEAQQVDMMTPSGLTCGACGLEILVGTEVGPWRGGGGNIAAHWACLTPAAQADLADAKATLGEP